MNPILEMLLIGVFPFVLYYLTKKYFGNEYNFLKYFFSGIVLSTVLIFGLAYLNELDTKQKLIEYNAMVYNSDFNEFQISYENVAESNLESVKILERSFMGIGWPLKAMLFAFVYQFYVLIIYFILHVRHR